MPYVRGGMTATCLRDGRDTQTDRRGGIRKGSSKEVQGGDDCSVFEE